MKYFPVALKKILRSNLYNYRGWNTSRKIVVIESDDWGSIRMPSREVYEELLGNNIRVDLCPYNKYDSLASEEDIEELFGVLTKFKDVSGNHPVITANTIVANPDFNKIRESNFTRFYYEIFTETLNNYKNHQNSFSLWKQGMNLEIFRPQFHGREHLNINRWMNGLKAGLPETNMTFAKNMFGISTTITNEKRKSYMAAMDIDNLEDVINHEQILTEGLEIFEKLFGYRSRSFIAPNYTWHKSLESVLYKSGVKYIQGAGVQRIPNGQNQTIKKHSLGEQNKFGQIYLTRNCFFEPFSNPSIDWVNSCLSEISNAFFWKKPAVIESHRVNYIGCIDPKNRDRNLRMFNQLLVDILRRWPDVEFMTSEKLGDLIMKNQD